MPIIRQDNLFDMQELFEMEPTHRFNAIFSTLELAPLLRIFDKKTHRGAGIELRRHDLFVDRSCGGADSDD